MYQTGDVSNSFVIVCSDDLAKIASKREEAKANPVVIDPKEEGRYKKMCPVRVYVFPGHPVVSHLLYYRCKARQKPTVSTHVLMTA